MSDTEFKNTKDHSIIQAWLEKRGGYPVTEKDNFGNPSPHTFGIHFQDHTEEDSYVKLSWEEFFKRFDEHNMSFLYQETEEGDPSDHFMFEKEDVVPQE